MDKIKKRRPRDFNALAASIVAEATSEKSTEVETSTKNPAAVALGRFEGRAGSAEKLSAKKQKEIVQKAASVRWAAKSDKS